MTITLRERRYLDRYRCVDSYREIQVGELAFKQGDLFYFKKGRFEYLVLAYDAREDCYYR